MPLDEPGAAEPELIKVRVVLEVTVHPANWRLAYGPGPGLLALVDDVKSYVLNQVQGAGATEERAILRTELKRS